MSTNQTTTEIGASAVTGLAAELGKREAFDRVDLEAWLSVVRTAEALRTEEARLFRGFKVSASQYNVMRILRGHADRDIAEGREPQGLPVRQIAQEMVTRDPDLTRLTDRLVSMGFVERVRCPKDRRRVFVVLTDEGRAVTGKIEEPLLRRIALTMGRVGEDDLRRLNDILVLVRRSFESADG